MPKLVLMNVVGASAGKKKLFTQLKNHKQVYKRLKFGLDVIEKSHKNLRYREKCFNRSHSHSELLQ